MAFQLLCQYELANVNGIPSDSFVNTVAVEGAGVAPTDFSGITAALKGLYTAETLPAMYGTLGSLLSESVDRASGACKIKLYDISGHLDGSPHGSPIAVDTFTMPAPAGSEQYANQLAAVITLRTRDALTSPIEGAGGIRPRQRRSGKIFFGPLGSEAFATKTNPNPILSNRMMNDAVHAVELLQELLNTQGVALAVWSRTDANTRVVVSAECDNSVDVIRSRKLKPTVRTKRVFDPVPDLALGA